MRLTSSKENNSETEQKAPVSNKRATDPFMQTGETANPFSSISNNKYDNPLGITAPGNIQLKRNDTGLPDNLKAGIEQFSGFNMDDVRVHYNSAKPAQLRAHAYAQGSQIHLGPGQERHLPHEAWHVVQQKQGRVEPTLKTASGIAINDNKHLEDEADRNGAMLASGVSVYKNSTAPPVSLKKIVTQLVGDDQENENAENDARKLSWSQWFWKYKWWLLAGAAMTAAAAYLLYKRFGGATELKTPPTTTPDAPGLVSSEAPNTVPGGEVVHAPSPDSSVSASSGIVSSAESGSDIRHAWTPGQKFTHSDALLHYLARKIPGAGLIIEGLQQIAKRELDPYALLAEIAKLHPATWPAGTYDDLATALSYLSGGKYEVPLTKHIIEFIVEHHSKMSVEQMLAAYHP